MGCSSSKSSAANSKVVKNSTVSKHEQLDVVVDGVSSTDDSTGPQSHSPIKKQGSSRRSLRLLSPKSAIANNNSNNNNSSSRPKAERTNSKHSNKHNSRPDNNDDSNSHGSYRSGGSSKSSSSKNSNSSGSGGGNPGRIEESVMKKIRAHRAVFSKGFFDESLTSMNKLSVADVKKRTMKESSIKKHRNKTPKSKKEIQGIIKALVKCYLFSDLADEQLKELAEHMWKETVSVGTTVMTQGEGSGGVKDNSKNLKRGSKSFLGRRNTKEKLVAGGSEGGAEQYFYVIESGSFDFLVDGKSKTSRSGNKGSHPYFGELALLYDAPRSATAVCTKGGSKGKGATLWAIDRYTFRFVVARHCQKMRKEFKSAVRRIPLLKDNLTSAQTDLLTEAMQLVRVKAGQRILKKGEQGNVCYFIKEGEVECTKIGDTSLGSIVIGPESYFGERALLTDEPRAADVTAKSACVLMALDRNAFIELLGPLRAVMDENMKTRVMQAVPILSQFSDSQRTKMVEKFKLIKFGNGDVIVKEGDEGDRFYIVRSGSVTVERERRVLATLNAGEWFGEMALLNKVKRTATCRADGRVECFSMTQSDFKQLHKSSPLISKTSERREKENKRNDNKSSSALRRSQSMRESSNGDLHRRERKKRSSMSASSSLSSGSSRGSGGSRGKSKSRKSKSAMLLRDGDDTDSVSGSESGGSSSRHSRRNRSNKDLLSRKGSRKQNRVKDDSLVALDKLERLKILGKGTFGTVFLVQNTKGTLWALKTMNKAHLVECEQERNVVNEKTVLAESKHPFILELIGTYQDRDALYMLLEFVQGGELFSIMQDKFRLPVIDSRFYAACIIDAFEYLHKLSIIYRDLKPENVLIGRDGYVKMADFGFAKKISGKTYTLCGTPEYLAPEVVLGQGHDKGVDYWGVGVLLYEMLVGISPFADEYGDDQIIVCKNIVSGKVDYDRLKKAVHELEGKSVKVSSAKPIADMISKLLAGKSHQRLGCQKEGAGAIKKHKFFNEAISDWSALRNKQIAPPYLPQIKGPLDTSHFDEFEADSTWAKYTGPTEWCKGF